MKLAHLFESELDGLKGPAFGRALKIAREKKNMSREELAKKSGVALNTIEYIEDGEDHAAGGTKWPQKKTMEALKKALS